MRKNLLLRCEYCTEYTLTCQDHCWHSSLYKYNKYKRFPWFVSLDHQNNTLFCCLVLNEYQKLLTNKRWCQPFSLLQYHPGGLNEILMRHVLELLPFFACVRLFWKWHKHHSFGSFWDSFLNYILYIKRIIAFFAAVFLWVTTLIHIPYGNNTITAKMQLIHKKNWWAGELSLLVIFSRS